MERRLLKKGLLSVLFFLVTLNLSQVYAAGLLKPVNGGASTVRMASHHVAVTINNGFTRTEVDQVFTNTGTRDLEAVYSFPVPVNASLSELSLWIDGREVTGEVMEKAAAAKVYQEQKAKGNDTALAEKKEYVAFNISVSPVRANKDTRVRLVYYQPVELDLNIGRYVYPLAEGGVDTVGNSFWEMDSVVQSSFKFNLKLKSAYPVKDVRVPTYENKAVIKKTASENEAGAGEIYDISLNSGSGTVLDKDIVFYYRLNDETPARVEMVPYRGGDDDGSFMVVITPGGELNKLKAGTDWTFVLDVSGSMSGDKMYTLGAGVVKVINKMQPEDRFRIITFSDYAKDYSGGYLKATRTNVMNMVRNVKNLRTGGSTALYAGLEMAYRGIEADRSTGIILVTDGVANDGPSSDVDIVELHEKYDVRLFSFVIGNSANQPLLTKLAKDSGGFSMNISNSDDIVGRIIQAKSKLTHECLYNTELTISGGDVYQLTPGDIGNIYKGQQIVMFGRYATPEPVEIKLSGIIAGEKKVWTCRMDFPEKDTDNPEVERLWALSSIQDLKSKILKSPYNDSLKKKIVDLGVDYSLVTDYTSMVVVNEVDMESMGLDRKNARRISKERRAQKKKDKQPVKNYRKDNGSKTSSRTVFRGFSAPNIGTGPVGPLFVVFALWMSRRRKKH